jgi:hypothetical protein
VVFTVLQELNMLIYRNQRDFYNLLFRCAAESLQELASDKKYLGAAIGLTAVLHIWGTKSLFSSAYPLHCSFRRIVIFGQVAALTKEILSSGTGTLPQIQGQVSGAAQIANSGY